MDGYKHWTFRVEMMDNNYSTSDTPGEEIQLNGSKMRVTESEFKNSPVINEIKQLFGGRN